MKYEYYVAMCPRTHKDSQAEWLDQMSIQGWRLVAVHEHQFYFEKPTSE